MNRTQFWVAGGVVLVAVGFVGWKTSRPPKVDVIIVRLQNVTSTLAVSGALEAENRAIISSRLNGALVSKVFVDIGDKVQKGEILLKLDDRAEKTALASADAFLKQSQSQTRLQEVLARSALENVNLAEQATSAVNDLRVAVAAARTQESNAQTALQTARANLAKTVSASRNEQVRIAKAQVASATANLAQAQKDADRATYLFTEGAISKQEYEKSQTALVNAREQLSVQTEQLAISTYPRTEDVTLATLQVQESQTVLEGTRKQLALAETALSARISSRQQLAKAQGELSAAIASKQSSLAGELTADAKKREVLASLEKTVIRSPFSGFVSQRLIEPGQTTSAGAPLFVLSGATSYRVRLNIEESRISSLKVGQSAVVGLDAFPELQLPAIVSEISSAANFQLGTIEVRLALTKSDPRLKPDLTVDANIILATFKEVVVIPQSALLVSGKKGKVYVLKGGTVTTKEVIWSRGNQGNIIVTKGLLSGDQVLTNPRATKPKAKVVPNILDPEESD